MTLSTERSADNRRLVPSPGHNVTYVANDNRSEDVRESVTLPAHPAKANLVIAIPPAHRQSVQGLCAHHRTESPASQWVIRYDAESLLREFGLHFRLIESAKELHQTPFRTIQRSFTATASFNRTLGSSSMFRPLSLDLRLHHLPDIAPGAMPNK